MAIRATQTQPLHREVDTKMAIGIAIARDLYLLAIGIFLGGFIDHGLRDMNWSSCVLGWT